MEYSIGNVELIGMRGCTAFYANVRYGNNERSERRCWNMMERPYIGRRQRGKEKAAAPLWFCCNVDSIKCLIG